MTIRRIAAVIALSVWSSTAAAAASNVTGDGEGKHPSVAADDKGGLHVAYEAPAKGATTTDESTNGGKSFGKAKNVSNSPGVSKEPDVTIANGKVFSIWEEEEGGKAKVKIVAASLP